jgi:hypothetical protein
MNNNNSDYNTVLTMAHVIADVVVVINTPTAITITIIKTTTTMIITKIKARTSSRQTKVIIIIKTIIIHTYFSGPTKAFHSNISIRI